MVLQVLQVLRFSVTLSQQRLQKIKTVTLLYTPLNQRCYHRKWP